MSILDNFCPTENPCNISVEDQFPDIENEITIGADNINIFTLISDKFNFNVADFIIMYKQGTEVMLIKSSGDCTQQILPGGLWIEVPISSDDTLIFDNNCLDIYAQVKYIEKSGKVFYSEPDKIKVNMPIEFK